MVAAGAHTAHGKHNFPVSVMYLKSAHPMMFFFCLHPIVVSSSTRDETSSYQDKFEKIARVAVVVVAVVLAYQFQVLGKNVLREMNPESFV